MTRLARWMSVARLYFRFLGIHLRAVLEYQSDFWLMLVAAALTQVVGVVFLGAVFSRIPYINGWSFWDVALMYATVSMAEGIGSIFFEGAWQLAGMLNTGEFDYLLVRPYPVVLQLTSGAIGVNGIGNLATGALVAAAALAHLRAHWSVGLALAAAVVFLSAMVVKTAITVAASAASFWLGGPNPVVAYAIHHVGELARYPIGIYGKGVQIALTLVLPFAFVGFFPVNLLAPGHRTWWLGLLTPAVAGYAVAVALLVFRRGLRRYDSAGN